MIQILNLSKSFGGQLLYDDITFNINSREKIGLVGRNGHGKTTLFHLILGNITPDSGTISIPKNYRIGYLEQHIHFTQETVFKEACLGLRDEDKYETWKAEKILSGLGFSKEDMEKPCSVFSGGYQIRLNLAKVLVSNPDMLLLDEPNNYLDIVTSRWLIKFLKSWQGELMLITHDRGFMDSVTTHTVGIHRQKVRKVKGGTDKLYNQLASEEEVYEKTRINEEIKRNQLEVFISRFRAKARLASQVQSKIKMLEKMGEKKQLEAIEKLDFSFKSLNFEPMQMMSASNISFSYTGEKPMLIDNFSLNIGKKERIFVIGKNGKGKSTLLKLLTGNLEPLSGTIKTHPTLATGYFGQPNMLKLNPDNTVLDEIMSAAPSCQLQQARSIAGMLMFKEDNALKKISVLSGGEKNRVLMGKIVATPCHLLVLDEPTNHLDMDSCEALMDAIDEFNGSVIVVTHDENFLKRLAKRLIIFDENKIRLFEGSYQEFLDNVGWYDEQATNKGATPEPTKHSNAEIRNIKIEPHNTTIKNEKKPSISKEKLQRKYEKILAPHKKKVSELENRIEFLEAENQALYKLLIKASTKSDGVQIAELSKKISVLKKDIDSHYEKLTKANEELETCRKELEKQS